MTTAGATRRVVSMPEEDPGVMAMNPEAEAAPPLTVEDVPRDDVPVAQPEAPATEAELEKELGPDDELWPKGPTLTMVNQWKDQYGAESVYVTSLTPSYHVVWRTLTRFEYRRLVKNLEQAVASGQVSQAEANMNNEEQVVEICVLHPTFTRQQLAGELAGLPSAIAGEVMEASAFVSVDVRQL